MAQTPAHPQPLTHHFTRRRALQVVGTLALAGVLTAGPAACDRPPTGAPTPQGGAPRIRIACLSPGAAATLIDLGVPATDAHHHDAVIVGKHDYDLVLPASVPACGHQDRLDYERLLSVRPTHVIIEWGQRPLPPRLTALAAEQGWTIVPLRMLTIEEIDASIATLHALVARSPELPDPSHPHAGSLAATLEALAPSPAGVAEPSPRVLVLASMAPDLGAVGPGSSHHEVLVRLGARSALLVPPAPATPAPVSAGSWPWASASPWVRLTAEDVLIIAPDAIVLLDPRAVGAPAPAWGEPWGSASPPDAEVERRLGRVADLNGVPAIANGRVAIISEPTTLVPGTPLARFARSLAIVLEVLSSP